MRRPVIIPAPSEPVAFDVTGFSIALLGALSLFGSVAFIAYGIRGLGLH